MNRRFTTKTVALTGLLASAALALAALEGLLPLEGVLPPGVKPGLSNVVTMFAAFTMGFPAAAAVTLCKALFALLTRGATAGFLSLAGGLLSTAAICLLLKIDRNRRLGFFGVSLTGAVCHNLGQLCAAALLTTPAVFWYAPVLIVSAVAAGALTGVLLRAVFPYLAPLINTIGGHHHTERKGPHA